MQYQTLGATGLRVSGLCLGTWQLSGVWGEDTSEAVRAVSQAFDQGVNFFDTAYAYGVGAAETGLARGLGDLMTTRRDELVLCTKGGLEMRGPMQAVRNSDPDFLRHTLELSLRALGTDYVDIYTIHWPDPTVPFAETAAALDGFVREGLVRHTAVSNFSVPQMRDFVRGGSLGVAQVPYHLFNRQVEDEILPFCQQHDVGVMGWGALAHGLLTGALRADQTFPDDDWRASSPDFQGELYRQRIAITERLGQLAADKGCTLAQLAIAWVRQHPAGVVPIIGAQIPEHLTDSLRALDVVLSPEEAREIAEIAGQSPTFDIGAAAAPETR